MSRGSRNGTPTSGHAGAAAAAASQQQQQMRRGNKTLGWYISDKILDKSDHQQQGQQNGGGGGLDRASNGTPTPAAMMASSATARPLAAVGVNNYRKGSLESQHSAASSPKSYGGQQQQQNAFDDQRHQQQQHKKNSHHHHLHRPRANSTNVKPSNSNKENHPQRKDSAHAMTTSGSTTTPPAATSRANVKEDYWYYDPVSDGFYYEHSGTRGWRKRNPKLHGQVPLPNGVLPKQQVPKSNSEEEVKDQKQQQFQQQTSAGNNRPLPPQQPQMPQTSKFFPNVTAAAVTTVPPTTTTIAAGASGVNVPNIKYYDAASDGFFYEMASVDGWRRRQPIAGGSGISPPNNGSAFQQQKPQHFGGSANARIFHPSAAVQLSKQQQQQFGRGGGGKVPQQGGPLQHQPYLAKQPQQLTSAEIDEIMLMHHHATQPLNIFGGPPPPAPQTRHQRGMTVPPAASASAACCVATSAAATVAPCCCCQAAAAHSCPMASAAAQLLQDRMQQLLSGGSKTSSRHFAAANSTMDCSCCNGTVEAPSNASVSSSLSSDVDTVDSPPINGGVTTTAATVDGSGWQLPESRHNSFSSSTGSQIRKWNGSEGQANNNATAGTHHPFSALLGSAQPMDITKNPQKTLVGSFDEPYEFYWSDSDAKSNASSATMLARARESNGSQDGGTAKSEAALSVSSMDLDYDLDTSESAAVGSLKQQLPVGSGGRSSMLMTMNGNGEEHSQRSKVPLKRPDSLRLICPKLSAATAPALVDLPTLTNGTNNAEKDPTPAAYRPYFNVDKFIADLPPFVDPEKILHNLSALRTPMTDQQNTFGGSRTNGAALATTDSPLFTPIMLKEENAWWTSTGLSHPKPIGGDRDITSTKANKTFEKTTTASADSGAGLFLKDLERIWQCPPAAF